MMSFDGLQVELGLSEICNLCDEHVVDLGLLTLKHNNCMRLNSNAYGSFTFMNDYGNSCVILNSVEQVEVCVYSLHL